MESREIKFRALCDYDDISGMVYFDAGMFDNGVFCMPNPNNISHINEYLSPLMQYTGLKDKNGKEIYEGDILSIDKIANLYHKAPIIVIGVVIYNQGKYESDTKKVTNSSFYNKSSIHFGVEIMDWIHLPEFHKSEVIGNIYENPELIKKNITL